jgi:GH18 family chitinase
MKKWVLLLVCSIASINVFAQNEPKRSANFRVIGYLRTNDIINGRADSLNLSNITHINIAFINPDSAGSFSVYDGIIPFVTRAHTKKIKILISIGGGLAPAYFTDLLGDKERNRLIDNIITFLKQYDLDGVDVDLEGILIDKHYDNFIVALSDKLKADKKLLTAAIATIYKDSYTDRSLSKFDFINIMSYDKTGPWKPAIAGPHAPYAMAEEDLNYWTIDRGLNKGKLNLGLPFYGYGFGTGVPVEASYRDLIKKYKADKSADQLTALNGGTVYYNGTNTIRNKTELAFQKAGGIMIWQLLQDASDIDSLLNVIREQINTHL